MVTRMNRSIDLMEELADESGNIFHLNRRGDLYLTADERRLPEFVRVAAEPSNLGAGPLRTHRGDSDDPEYISASQEGFHNLPTGADLFLNPKLIQQHFPYLPENIVGALHVRRAGWLSAQQMGAYMLARARAQGVKFTNARITEVNVSKGKIQAVKLSNGDTITTRNYINAAGPYARQIGNMLGINLPIYNHLHLKVAFRDAIGVVPREAPLLIWKSFQTLPWRKDERHWLAEKAETRWLLEQLPPGTHTRPEGTGDSDIILL